MELQLFDTWWKLYFRTTDDSFVYKEMQLLLKDTQYEAPFTRLASDFTIEHDGLSTILNILRAAVQDRIAALRLAPDLEISQERLSEFTIAGQQIFLYPLFSLHDELIQIHYLLDAITGIYEKNSDLRLLLLPKLTSVQWWLLKTLKETKAKVEREEINEKLRYKYELALKEGAINEDMKKALQGSSDRVSYHLTENMDFFKQWHLLEEDSEGHKIRATEKLQRLQL